MGLLKGGGKRDDNPGVIGKKGEQSGPLGGKAEDRGNPYVYHLVFVDSWS